MLKADKKIVVGILGLIIIVIGGILITNPKSNQGVLGLSDGTQILMTEKGFEPENPIVKVGTKVTFINKDKFHRWPASNLHPTHTIYSEFDPKGPIKPGESWEFTFKRGGEWNFHDHLSPLLTGKIIVNE